MPLSSGTRLGAYEIVGPLGAGGMGEVYRARDTRLDRTVALKILPPRFAERAEVRERFEREARVVSNLNHPNICTLYDVGQQDGTAYFVMEYLEGQSLAERLAKGPLPLEQVFRYAIDVADALAKAHQQGVVHRDLKPGNVMLTRAGAKLLDFGLARRGDTASSVVMPDAPTALGAAPLTTEGTILGTLQYMSPEQLEGQPVDGRSDIFAFGAVLYEMISGRRAFESASHASLIAKIIGEEPRPLHELQPVTPPALERLIHRCLKKEPDARWQCAGDLVAELRAIAAAPEVAEQAAVRRPASRLPWIAAGVFAIVAAVLATLLLRPKPAEKTVQFTMLPPPGAAFTFTPLDPGLAVSPAGDRIVYAATAAHARGLWVRSLDSATAKPLAGSEEASNPFWSPDGKSVAFFAGGKLQSVAVDGGTVQTICAVPPGAVVHGAWSPDGTIVLTQFVAGGGLASVSAAGGTPKPLPAARGILAAAFPRFLSDGRRFLFTGVGTASPALWAGSLDGTPPRQIAGEVSHVDYVAPWLVYARDGVVVTQRFDEDALQLVGMPESLAGDVRVYYPIGSSAHAAAGRTLVAMTNTKPPSLLWLDRGGAVLSEAAPPADYHNVRLSPDGKKIAAVLLERRTGVGSLWTVDRTRKTLTRISFNKADHEWPVWSPDARRLAFASDLEGPPHVFVQPASGGTGVQVVPISDVQVPYDWTERGIFYSDITHDTQSDIFIVSPDGGKPEVWLRTPADEWQPRVSADGKWVAFLSDQSGNREVYVAPIGDPSAAVQASSGGGQYPRWTRNGAELIYRRGARDVMAVEIRDGAAGDPRLLFTTSGDIADYDVTPEGDRFLIVRQDAAETAQPMTVMVNWKREK